MIASDFEILINEGNVGFYSSCEITQLFIQNKKDKNISNLYILASFEEKPFKDTNHHFLNKPIPFGKDFSIGIQRYHLTITQIHAVFKKLNEQSKWDFNGDDSLVVGRFVGLAKQFIPANDGQRLNHVLKNNFHNGSYILEYFDETKSNLDFLLLLENLKKLNQLSEQIKKVVPIDLSLVRDRVGNIVFQFPITVLKTSSKATSNWDGVEIKLKWHKKLSTPKDCLIMVDATIDKNYMGGAVVPYNQTESQIVIIGNIDLISHIKVWNKSPNLLLSASDGTYIKEFKLDMGIGNHEPRIFFTNGIQQKVTISSKGIRTGDKDEVSYTTYITNTLYDAEKKELEKSLSFKQYFNGSFAEAVNDLQKLIKANDKNGVCLWDPFLRSADIVNTMFFSPTGNVSLKAIGAIDQTSKIVYGKKGLTPRDIIDEENIYLNNPGHNNFALNLEFRMQHGRYGWNFHDRFLIFPGSKSVRPKVYSLGTSVNAIGKSHHILQEVSHPQRVVDAFNELWDKLDHRKCLVWKSLKK